MTTTSTARLPNPSDHQPGNDHIDGMVTRRTHRHAHVDEAIAVARSPERRPAEAEQALRASRIWAYRRHQGRLIRTGRWSKTMTTQKNGNVTNDAVANSAASPIDSTGSKITSSGLGPVLAIGSMSPTWRPRGQRTLTH